MPRPHPRARPMFCLAGDLQTFIIRVIIIIIIIIIIIVIIIIIIIITPHLCRLALRLALDQAGPARQPALPVQRSHAAPRHRAEAGQIFLVRCKYFHSFILDILYSQFSHLALVGQGLVEGGEAPALAVTAHGPRPAHPGILAVGGESEGRWWI